MTADSARRAAAPPAPAAGLARARLDPAVGHVVVGQPRLGPGRGARGHAAAPAAAGRRAARGCGRWRWCGSSGTSWSTWCVSGGAGGLAGAAARAGWHSGDRARAAAGRLRPAAHRVAETLSLVPGSLVLDLDREERLIAVHLLHVADLADVERQKADVLADGGADRARVRHRRRRSPRWSAGGVAVIVVAVLAPRPARRRRASSRWSGWPAARRCWTGSSPPTPCW